MVTSGNVIGPVEILVGWQSSISCLNITLGNCLAIYLMLSNNGLSPSFGNDYLVLHLLVQDQVFSEL